MMRRLAAVRAALMAALLAALLATSSLPAQADEVPYVQTSHNVVDAMLDIAGVRGTDFLIDLGSGDGRIVITAAQRYGTRGMGIDYDKRLVQLSTQLARKAGVGDRVAFVEKNIFDIDLSPASVLTMYLLPEVNLELRPKILAQLKPGTRVVSHDWDMGDWEPDARVRIHVPDKPVGARKESTVYMWVVPARVDGKWRTRVPLAHGPMEIELDLDQRYQTLGGAAVIDGKRLPVERAFVRGPFVFFRVGDGADALRFQGSLRSDRIVGRVSTADGATYPWRALRAADK